MGFGSMSLWTRREREVIALVRQGLSYDEIAAELGISASTVRTHVSSIGGLLPGRQSPLRKILTMDHYGRKSTTRGD